MNKLVLKLEGKVIELALHDTEAGMLYKAQDLLKGGLGLTTKQAAKKLENWKETGQYPTSGVSVIKGGKATLQGTYLSQENLYGLAAYVSPEFYKAVFEAFTAAAQGDGKVAVDIATSVAIPPELIDREKVLRLQMNTLIDIEAGDDPRKRANLYTNFNRLIAKGVSGYTPKELTGGDLSSFDYIVKHGHKGGVSAYLATMELIITGLFAKLDYHTIALMLRVETGKNKDIVSKLK
jgi:hypothetical protein